MPCFNAEKYISESIKSILAQSMSQWEALIINDFSTDRTKEIIEEFSKKDSRIRIFNLEVNGGAAKARNIGIENSRYKYIAFLDSDDLWKPEKLSFQISLMEQENIQFSYTSYYIIDDKGNISGIRKAPKLLNYNKLIRFGNDIGCLTVAYNRERFINKRFDESIRGHEDYKMWLDIVKDIEEVHPITEPLSLYRVHPGQKNLNKWRSLIWNWEVWYKYEKLGLFTTFVTSVRWIVFKIVQRFFVPYNLKN